jgi:hypothetical protein
MRATAGHAAEMMNMLATSTREKWERGRQQEEQPTRADGSGGAPLGVHSRVACLLLLEFVRSWKGAAQLKGATPTAKVGFHWWGSRSRTKCRRLALFSG